MTTLKLPTGVKRKKKVFFEAPKPTGVKKRPKKKAPPQPKKKKKLEKKISTYHRVKALDEAGVRDWMIAEFPKVFTEPTPLEKNQGYLVIEHAKTMRDELPFSIKQLRDRIKFWCGSIDYLAVVAAGGRRYFIDGSEGSEIIERDIEYSKEQIKYQCDKSGAKNPLI